MFREELEIYLLERYGMIPIYCPPSLHHWEETVEGYVDAVPFSMNKCKVCGMSKMQFDQLQVRKRQLLLWPPKGTP